MSKIVPVPVGTTEPVYDIQVVEEHVIDSRENMTMAATVAAAVGVTELALGTGVGSAGFSRVQNGSGLGDGAPEAWQCGATRLRYRDRST